MCIAFLGDINWQLTANVATTLALVTAICALLYQMTQSSKEQSYSTFTHFCEAFDKLTIEGKDTWKKIKEKILSNPKTAHEIPDKSNSFHYLKLRLNQSEDYFAVENELIENEIQSICILNQMCKLALSDSNKMLLLNAKYGSEVSFYQNNVSDLVSFREKSIKKMSLTKIQSQYIKKVNVSEYFGK